MLPPTPLVGLLIGKRRSGGSGGLGKTPAGYGGVWGRQALMVGFCTVHGAGGGMHWVCILGGLFNAL